MRAVEVPFEGIEPIPGLRVVKDDNGEAAFFTTRGNCPIVIAAPHASRVQGDAPAGARAFGKRRDDPTTGKEARTSDDDRMRDISFAVVRTLCALGFAPYSVINCVSREYMDLNRRWTSQAMWGDPPDGVRPGDELKSSSDFPRVAEFRKFMQMYYERFHDTLKEYAELVHPQKGWIFAIHGMEGSEPWIQVFTGRGNTARRDYVYGRSAAPVSDDSSFHSHLRRNDLVTRPATNEPADEGGVSDLISDDLYGARNYGASSATRQDNVVPAHPPRLHGVQLEFSRAYRRGEPEQMESLGIRLAYAVAGFLRDNGLITVNREGLPGNGAVLAHSQLG